VASREGRERSTKKGIGQHGGRVTNPLEVIHMPDKRPTRTRSRRGKHSFRGRQPCAVGWPHWSRLVDRAGSQGCRPVRSHGRLPETGRTSWELVVRRDFATAVPRGSALDASQPVELNGHTTRPGGAPITKAPAKSAKPKRGLTAPGRKALSIAMKKRWAAKKAVA
jgi:hypothetical protein